MTNAAAAEAWRPAGPFVLEVDLASTALADLLEIAPGTERTAARTVGFTTDDVRMLYRAVLTWMNLGRRVAPDAPIE